MGMKKMNNPYNKQIGGTHYQNFKIQPSKFVIENELLYPEGCVIKYILRHRLKGKRQDLEKAKHFIDMIIERDYPEKKDFLEEAEKEKKFNENSLDSFHRKWRPDWPEIENPINNDRRII